MAIDFPQIGFTMEQERSAEGLALDGTKEIDFVVVAKESYALLSLIDGVCDKLNSLSSEWPPLRTEMLATGCGESPIILDLSEETALLRDLEALPKDSQIRLAIVLRTDDGEMAKRLSGLIASKLNEVPGLILSFAGGVYEAEPEISAPIESFQVISKVGLQSLAVLQPDRLRRTVHEFSAVRHEYLLTGQHPSAGRC